MRSRSWLALMLLAGSVHAAARVDVETVVAPSLSRSRIGESDRQRVAIYLPPGYDADAERRYPVLYLLHRSGGGFRDWTAGAYRGLRIQDELDRGIAAGRLPPLIVVMPDANNRYLGGFYADSPVTGDWEAFIAEDLTRWVDRRYRTVDGAMGRGITGHSMGGHGALRLAMRHPDRFGAVYAMSPSALGFGGELGTRNPAWSTLLSLRSLDDLVRVRDSGDPYAVALLGYLAVALPDPDAPPFYVRLPFRRYGATLIPEEPAYTRFVRSFPVNEVADRRDELARLYGIGLDFGDWEEFEHVSIGARAFSAELDRLGIRHTLTEYAGDHQDRVRERLLDHALPFLIERLRWADR